MKALTSHNPIGLRDLFQGEIYLFFLPSPFTLLLYIAVIPSEEYATSSFKMEMGLASVGKETRLLATRGERGTVSKQPFQ
jgi:hypothetical protein